MTVTRSIMLFALAGLAEIGGGYLMWIWLRADRPVWVGLLGALILILYGLTPRLVSPDATALKSVKSRVYRVFGDLFHRDFA